MTKPKVLFVSQEITPYLPENEIRNISRYLPQGIQAKDKEIRIFMPRYGCINERRHQLHEVIRLSGINLIINDSDHPLIIKVASIHAAKMQVYFIDNEEYFKRKFIFTDEKDVFYDDNDERSIFFCRGVLETIKKLGWAPDIVHCHGWMTGIMPLYLKKIYNNDPMFANSKVIFSVYDNKFPATLDKDFHKKVVLDTVTEEDTTLIKTPSFVNVNKLGIDRADAIIIASENISTELQDYIAASGKPVLEYQDPDNYINAYSDFYDSILEEVPVELTE